MRELSLAILDIAENSIKALASHIRIEISALRSHGNIYIKIEDDGCGTSSSLEELRSKSNGDRSGLGLILAHDLALMCGGELELNSARHSTTVSMTLGMYSPDLPPLGDIASTVVTLLIGSEVDIDLCYRTDDTEFTVRSAEITSKYNDKTSISALNAVKRAINEKFENINGGNPYEKFS